MLWSSLPGSKKPLRLFHIVHDLLHLGGCQRCKPCGSVKRHMSWHKCCVQSSQAFKVMQTYGAGSCADCTLSKHVLRMQSSPLAAKCLRTTKVDDKPSVTAVEHHVANTTLQTYGPPQQDLCAETAQIVIIQKVSCRRSAPLQGINLQRSHGQLFRQRQSEDLCVHNKSRTSVNSRANTGLQTTGAHHDVHLPGCLLAR